jgi:hypothetical protein
MQRRRIVIAVVIILALGGVVLGIDAWRRSQVVDLAPGSVPIYQNGRLVASFLPTDLDQLEQVRFTDAEEGKVQEGWLLRDVLLLYMDERTFDPDTQIVVSSSSRAKSAELIWAEVADTENMVMFDLSGRGTLKLVSMLERLDVRDEWVQDVDKIEIGAQ